MEVKPGYKQTEVGVIPEEWGVARVAELVTTGPKNGYSGRSGKEARGTPTLSLGATSSGSMVLNEETVKRLDESICEHSDLYLKPGDVLVQRSNTPDLVGTTAVFDGPAGVYVYPDLMMRMRFRDEATAHFFWRYANSTNGRRFFVSIAAGSSGSMPKISGEKLRKMQLPHPPLPEQRAIATALSDVDGLLGGLDRLIAKKRDLKQAAMQQLLTGQTRLPGFHGEWEETTLGDIGECIIGLTYKPENVVKHGLLVLRSSNVQNGRIAYDDNVYVNLEVAEHLYTQVGDLLICVRNGSRALIGKCAVIDQAAAGLTFGAFMAIYRTKHWRFVVHSFQGDDLQRQIRDNIGATINQITNKDMKAFRIKLPPDAEQTAIAEVLSEMDGELALLEQRREKTRALKQAMMQELLTGRTRLV